MITGKNVNSEGVYTWSKTTSKDGKTVTYYVELTCTNTYTEAGLTVKKVVETEYAGDIAPTDDEFTVRIQPTSIDTTGVELAEGENAYTYFNTGTYTYGSTTATVVNSTSTNAYGYFDITLKNGESITIKGLPNGTYTVQEQAAASEDDEYIYDVTAETVTMSGNSPTVTITNIYKQTSGELAITKTVVDPSFTADSFTFTVTADEDVTLPSTIKVKSGSGTVKVEENVATVTLPVDTAKSATVTLEGIPSGNYTVAETAVANYTTTVKVGTGNETTSNSADVTISAASTTTVAYTNTRQLGNLVITKTVAGKHIPANDSFAITVNLYADANKTALSGTYTYTVTDANGASVTTGNITGGTPLTSIKDGYTVTISNLPVGASYVTVENVDDDYSTTVSKNNAAAAAEASAGTTGTIDTDGETVAYINTYKTGNLAITKSGLNADDTAIFKVLVTKDADGYSETFYVSMNNETKTLTDLPYNATYTVTEEDGWSWRYETTSGVPANGSIPYNSTATVTVVNDQTEDKWLSDESSVENNYNNLDK